MKNSIRLASLLNVLGLLLFTGNVQAGCPTNVVEPRAGENLWNIVARIGNAVDEDSTRLCELASSVDECCLALTSLTDDVQSSIDVVDSKVDACCLELSSSIDVIESKLDACCVALNSKLDLLLECACPV